MTTENEFETAWLEGEEAGQVPDEGAKAVRDGAKEADAQSQAEYLKSHAELEDEAK